MPLPSRGAAKVANSIRDLVAKFVQPLSAAIRPPEVLIVTSFSGNTGSAISKQSGLVSIKASMMITSGMAVVGVPTGPREFYVVGYY